MIFHIAFALYGLMLVGAGLYGASRVKTSSDFLIGSRGLNYWITALSAHASDMGAWLFFGLPAAVYANGLSDAAIALGLIGGMWLTWQYIAPRLRTQSEASNSMTLTHFLAHAAKAKGHALIVTSSLLLVFFFVFYLAAGLKGVGNVLHFAFGIEYLTGVLLTAACVMLYTMIGGYVAVAFTDAFQAVFLLTMIILVPIVTWWHLPAGSLTFAIPTITPQTMGATLSTALTWGLGYFGMPHVLTKFMSIDSVDNVKKAQRVGLVWQALALGSAVSIGLLARHYFVTAPASGEQLFMQLVTQQFTPLLAGLILCAILAATISTLDAQLIVCATIITRDVYQPRNSVAQVRLTRTCIALLTGIAVVIASQEAQSIHEIVRYAWAGLGATLGPLVLMSLFARRHLHQRGALLGMVVGGLTAALWPHYGAFMIDAPLVPAFIAGLATMIAF